MIPRPAMRIHVSVAWVVVLAACEPSTPSARTANETISPATAQPANSALPADSPMPSSAAGMTDAATGGLDAGATRRAVRRGPPVFFAPVDPLQWRNATEHYVASVKPGNQRVLGPSGIVFARYLNAMHNRIHPIFTDSFLPTLDVRPKSDPINDPTLAVLLEIVLSADGQLLRMGVVQPSGQLEFDVAALASVERAAPYGPVPAPMLSSDGSVYVHWQFKRDEIYACTTMNARPFLLDLSSRPMPL